MYRIAALGDRDSVLGFKALGLDVFFAETTEAGRKYLHELASRNFAIIYITEQLSIELKADIDRYKDQVTPAIILIPGKGGTLGLGLSALKSAVERAVGVDLLN